MALVSLLCPREQPHTVCPQLLCSLTAHCFAGKLHWDDLMFEKTKYVPLTVYSQSKLANVLFARELQRRFTESKQNITAFSLHPGAGQRLLISLMLTTVVVSANGHEPAQQPEVGGLVVRRAVQDAARRLSGHSSSARSLCCHRVLTSL